MNAAVVPGLRLVSAVTGLAVSRRRPLWALIIWMGGGLLEMLEGPTTVSNNNSNNKINAGKASRFLMWMDVCSDNLLRMAGWLAATAANPQWGAVAVPLLLLEWCTTLAIQLHTACDEAHWKMVRRQDPLWMRDFLGLCGNQGFVTRLCLFGLMAADWVAFAIATNLAYRIPYFTPLATAAVLGRSLVVLVEVRLCISFVAWLLLGIVAKGDAWLQSLDVRKSFSVTQTSKLL